MAEKKKAGSGPKRPANPTPQPSRLAKAGIDETAPWVQQLRAQGASDERILAIGGPAKGGLNPDRGANVAAHGDDPTGNVPAPLPPPPR